DEFCALVAREEASRVGLTPSSAGMLVASAAPGRHDLSSVNEVLLAEGGARPTLLAGLAASFPSASVVDAGTLCSPSGSLTLLTYDRGRPGALGRAEPAGRVRILDDVGRAQPDGEVGHVRPALAGGEAAPPWVAEADEAWWSSSSPVLGYLDQGLLYVVTSRRDVVRLPRATVSAAEVGQVLCRHPAVTDAAVLGLPRNRTADRLAAAVVANSAVTADELREGVRRRLGDARTPQEILFTQRLPRNDSGCLLAGRLRRQLGLPVDRPLPERGDPDVQETIAAIWQRVLGREEVIAGDDFFELGGDELGAVRVRALIRDAFGVAPPVSTMLDGPTVGEQSSVVDRLRTAARGADASVAPVAFSQEGMLWHEQFAPGCQNLPPLARRYQGPLDVGALRRALSEVVRRHEPLRTTFELRDGRPVQVITVPAAFSLPVRDLTALAADEQAAELDRALAEATRPFDLVAGPLFEATLYRLGEDHHVLVVRTHHSVYDDWSVGVFRRELSALYTAFLTGAGSPLEDLPVSFAQFVRAQRRRLAGEEGTRQLSYWKRRLQGAPLALQLPIGDPDRPPGRPEPSAAPVAVVLSPELHAGVRDLARRKRATPFMILLAAFQVLLHRWTGCDDLLLSSVVANRNRRELEGLIGCFSKKIVLRLASPGDATFSEVLAGARGVLLEALANQDLPFETVVQEALGPSAAEHGLVPYPVVMFQGVAPPPAEVTLPGLASSGLHTSATTRRLHFAAGDDGRSPEEPLAWGAGLYSGTFLIVSVVEDDDELSLVARGAFHRPAVEQLLAGFRTLLADAVAHPDRRVSELDAALPAGAERGDAGAHVLDLRGFTVDLARIETALAGCPGVRDLAVVLREVAGVDRLVAYVVPDGEPPTLADLRVRLWRRLPGYAWPAAMVVVPDLARLATGGLDRAALPAPGGVPALPGPAEETVLADAWAQALGVERVTPTGNYWQAFSFLEAAAAVAGAGFPITPRQVARHRTLRTLGVDVAAQAPA
ncbi:MAG: condensation domain-containing protein, partial [Actinomycetota bacterium]|nr:condensation domain-containing protein [Actinomycetota bacterium]